MMSSKPWGQVIAHFRILGMKYSECVLLAALSMTLKEFSVHTNQKADDIKILYEVAGTPFPDVEIIFKQRNNKHPK